MKILQFISSPAAGGAEVYVKDLVKQFVSYGHEVFVGFLSHAADVGRSESYEIDFLRQLDEYGVEYFFIGSKARRNFLFGAIRLRSFVKNNNIELYHTHLKYGVVFGAFLNIPVIYTHHNITLGVGSWWRYISNSIVNSYIGISGICGKRLADYMKRNVDVVVNGVDKTRIAPSAKLREYPKDVLNIISVGSISPQKNYKLLVDSIALLPEKIRDHCVVKIVGEGPEAEMLALEKYIKLHRLEGIFYLLGNRGDVPLLLADSHLFLMSSEWEGLPISLIEAAMSGLPCVVTDVGGCSEVVGQCGNGKVVASGDAVGLAAAIDEIVSDPVLYNNFTTNALENADFFSIQEAAQKHINIYNACLSVD